ncbi:hypothetical protein [Bifidobacterium catenulatum]|uniref:Uncharacterized protein n=1 Tax=Bifidobacterium catenulatum subsp. kashiwanohense TaxID=630129 RepID=A0AA43P5W6_9BIFI|nr:hypothetical protein [Bifidobacterium catenulatum]MDH7889200.1 hypothetical protein [Bifidobacterium catenulatum subsp. kashiwanohense]
MASTEESFQQTQEALDTARLERARALQQVQTLCETGRRHLVIPFLMANMQRVPSLRKIRLWQLDSIMFNTSRRVANKTIRIMRETINDDSSVNDGYVTLGWALGSKEKTVRMTTWLLQLSLREKLSTFQKPEGFPYAPLYQQSTDDQQKEGSA